MSKCVVISNILVPRNVFSVFLLTALMFSYRQHQFVFWIPKFRIDDNEPICSDKKSLKETLKCLFLTGDPV